MIQLSYVHVKTSIIHQKKKKNVKTSINLNSIFTFLDKTI